MKIKRFTPQNVYYHMQDEYNKYQGKDKPEQDVDKKVLKNTVDYFESTENEILEQYNNFIYTNESVIKGFGKAMGLDIDEASALDGKRVIIDTDRIMTTKKEQSGKAYLDFIEKNKGKEFVARVDKVNKSMLYLEGEGFWLFDSMDLIKV